MHIKKIFLVAIIILATTTTNTKMDNTKQIETKEDITKKPNKKQIEVKEDVKNKKNDNNKEYDLENIVVNDVVKFNKLQKPELVDMIFKTPEATDKYTRKFAELYLADKDVYKEKRINIDELFEEAVKDEDTVLLEEMLNMEEDKKDSIKYALAFRLHLILPYYLDNIEFENRRAKESYIDEETHKYVIPSYDDIIEQSIEDSEDFDGNKIKSLRVPTREELDKVNQKADEIYKKMPKSLDREDRMKWIADELTSLSIYDDGKSGVALNNEYGALFEGRTRCDGISRAFTLIARKAGIPAYTMFGTTDRGNHAWNIVEDSLGNWKIIDLTSGISFKEDKVPLDFFLKNWEDGFEDYHTAEDTFAQDFMDKTKKNKTNKDKTKKDNTEKESK